MRYRQSVSRPDTQTGREWEKRVTRWFFVSIFLRLTVWVVATALDQIWLTVTGEDNEENLHLDRQGWAPTQCVSRWLNPASSAQTPGEGRHFEQKYAVVDLGVKPHRINGWRHRRVKKQRGQVDSDRRHYQMFVSRDVAFAFFHLMARKQSNMNSDNIASITGQLNGSDPIETGASSR